TWAGQTLPAYRQWQPPLARRRTEVAARLPRRRPSLFSVASYGDVVAAHPDIEEGPHMEPLVLSEKRGRVGWVTLNRPKALNALNDALIDQLVAALQGFDSEKGVGAIVITGSDKAFAAGADIAAMKDWSFVDAYKDDYITRN